MGSGKTEDGGTKERGGQDAGQFTGTVEGGCHDPASAGTGRKYMVNTGDRMFAIAETGATEKALRWLDLSTYTGCGVRISGTEMGDVIYGATVELTRLPDQQALNSMTVINTREDLRIEPVKSGELSVAGTLSPGGGGVFTKGTDAVVLGLKGSISIPAGFRFTLLSGQPDLEQAVQDQFAPSLKALPTPLPPKPKEVKTVDDMMALIRHATYARDKDFYFGDYPDNDPQVLAYLNRVAEARKHHEIADRRKRLRELKGMVRRDQWDEIGSWIAESIHTSGDSKDQRDNLYNGSREAVKADITKLIGLARGINDYQVRHEMQCRITAETLQELDNDIKNDLWWVDKEGYFDAAKIVLAPILGVAAVTYGTAVMVTQVRYAGDPPRCTALSASVFMAAFGAGFVAVMSHGYAESVVTERVSKIQKIQQKLAEVQHLEDLQADLEREKVSHEAVGEILTIMSETDERLKEELKRIGGHTPEDERDREWAYRKARYHVEDRLRELHYTKGPDDTFTRAILAKDAQTCGRIFTDYCSRANNVFRPAKAASRARTTSFMQGFATLNMPDTRKEPDAMWQ